MSLSNVAKANKMTKMLRAKFNFYTKQNMDYADMVQKAAELQAAKDKDIVVVTKDRDFIELLERYGSPPQILYLTIGNIPNNELQIVFDKKFLKAITILENEDQVEIGF